MTATALPRTIRVAALVLLALTPFVLLDLATAARMQGPIHLGPQLLAPVAAVGLLRGRRWGWALAVATTWLAIVALAVVLVGWLRGMPLQATLGTTPIAMPPAAVALALTGVLAFYLWLHWTLTRP